LEIKRKLKHPSSKLQGNPKSQAAREMIGMILKWAFWLFTSVPLLTELPYRD
jgi:hypothetical protein